MEGDFCLNSGLNPLWSQSVAPQQRKTWVRERFNILKLSGWWVQQGYLFPPKQQSVCLVGGFSRAPLFPAKK